MQLKGKIGQYISCGQTSGALWVKQQSIGQVTPASLTSERRAASGSLHVIVGVALCVCGVGIGMVAAAPREDKGECHCAMAPVGEERGTDHN